MFRVTSARREGSSRTAAPRPTPPTPVARLFIRLALALMLALGLATPAAAVTLVSNLQDTTSTSTIHSTSGHGSQTKEAQGFITGATAYTLTSVEIPIDNFGHTVTSLTAALHEKHATDDEPGDKVVDLTLQGTITANRTRQTLTYNAPANTNLATGTTYFLVLTVNGVVGIHMRTDDPNTETGLTGWSIHNTHHRFDGTDWEISGTDPSGYFPWEIKLEGTLAPNARPTSPGGRHAGREDSVTRFVSSHFRFSDADMDDTLASVKIVTLPANGQLKLDGTVITSVPQTVTRAQIDDGDLTYESDEDDWHGETTFTFTVSDGKADSADATMTIYVLPVPDVLPVTNDDSSGVRVTSTPKTDDGNGGKVYGAGDRIHITVTFDEPVKVGGSNPGSAVFEIRLGGPDPAVTRNAAYVSGTDTTALVFEYTVQSGDRDNNGIWIEADALMRHRSVIQNGDTVFADLTHAELRGQPAHKVDGSKQGGQTAPTVDWAPVISRDRPKELAITFSEDLNTTTPATSAFTVSVGSGTRDVSSVSISGRVVTLTMAEAFVRGEVVKVAYDKPATNPLQDESGAEADSFTGNDALAVTNNALVCSIDPSYGSTPPFWRACLTVGVSSSGNDFGLVGDGSGEGALSTASFTHEGTEYTIDGIVRSGTTLSISFDRALPDASNAWVFRVDRHRGWVYRILVTSLGRYYIRGNASHDTTTHTYTWNTTNIDWAAANVGDKVSVSLRLDPRPFASDSTVDTDEDTAYVFQASDFPYTHTGGDFPLERVQIQSLPTNGQLKLDGTVISSVGQWITKAQLDANQFTYEPPDDANGTGYAMFDFDVEVNGQRALYSATMTINVDSVPDVTGVAVTSEPTSGENTYGVGEKIQVTVTFDEPVTVTGSPFFRLQIYTTSGFQDRDATYMRGSGTTALEFEYVVVESDRDGNGVSSNADALMLNGGTIQDGDSNTADITHDALGNQSGHKVDGSIGTPAFSSALVTAAAPKELAITFDEALDTGSVPAASAFTVKVDGTAEATPTGVSISGAVVTLTLATALDDSQTNVTVDYTKPGTNPLKDAANNEVATFTGQSVTNNAPACPDTASHPGPGSTFWVSCLTVGVSSSGNDFGLVGDGSGEGALSTASFTHEGTEYTIDGIVRSGTTFSISFDRALPDASNAWVFGFRSSLGNISLYIRGNERDGLPATHTYDTTTHTYTWNYSPYVRWTAANVGDKGSVSLALYPRPWLSDSTVDTDEDTPYVFQASDFPYTHTGGDFPLEDVWILSLPANGQLKLDGTVLTEIGSNIVTRAQLDANQLTYEPPDDANGTGYETFYFSVRVNDQWGGIFVRAIIGHPTMTINVDSVPDVTGVRVTSTPKTDDGNGGKVYGAGDRIHITVTFDEPVTVTGTPVFEIRLGNSGDVETKNASFVSGTGTDALVFEYTVQSGDRDNNGIWIEADALKLNGGTIQDSDRNYADVTHAELRGQPDHKVDGSKQGGQTAPTVDWAPVISPGRPKELAITFSEDLSTTAPATSAFTVSVGSGTRDVSSVSISGRVVTLTMAEAFISGEVVKVAYDKPATNPLQDGSGAEADSFTGNDALAVTNNAPVCPRDPSDNSLLWVSCLTVGVSSSGNDFGLVGDGSGEGALSTASFTHEGTEYTIDGIVRSGTNTSISFDRALPDVSNAWVFGVSSLGTFYIRRPAGHDTTTHTYTWNTPYDPWTAANVGDKVSVVLAVDHRAWASDSTVDTDEDTPYVFQASDFPYTDPSGNDFPLEGVEIESLPTNGQLKLDGTVIPETGNFVTKARLDANQLTYEPPDDANGTGYAMFDFNVRVNGWAGVSLATMTINVDSVPDVTDVSVTSTPNSGTTNTYGRGEKIQVTVTFDEPVTVTGSPFFRLRIYTTSGFQDRDATYMRGSGTTALEFEYVVVESDRDGNGVSSNADALMLNGGTIQDSDSNDADVTHAELRGQPDHKVDGSLAPNARPTSPGGRHVGYEDSVTRFVSSHFRFSDADMDDTLASVKIVTLPANGQLKLDGTVITSVPQTVTRAQIDDGDLTYESDEDDWHGETTFTFTVSDGKADSADATMTITVLPVPDVLPVTNDETSGVRVTSTPKTDDGNGGKVYGAGDRIHITVTFDEPVRVSNNPVFAIRLGGPDPAVTRNAVYATGSGTPALVFEYTVQSGDRDNNGIWIEADALKLNGGTIQDSDRNNADVTHAELRGQPAHKVDGSRTPDETAPTVDWAAIETFTPKELAITFSEDLNTTAPATSAFTVSVTGEAVARAVSSVSISGRVVTLTMAEAFISGEVVKVAYDKPATNPLQDESGAEADSFTGNDALAVINGAPVCPRDPSYGSTPPFWLSCLTVGVSSSGNDFGLVGDGSGEGALSPASFTHEGTEYTIDGIVQSGTTPTAFLSLSFDRALPDVSNAWVFRVSSLGTFYIRRPAGHDTTTHTYTWNITSRPWDAANVGDKGSVSLALQHRPWPSDSTVDMDEDTPYVFQASDFPYTHTGGDVPLEGVSIISPPTNGQLKLDGTVITRREYNVTRAQLDANQLTYEPPDDANGTGYAMFDFYVRFNGRWWGKHSFGEFFTHATMTINVDSVPDVTGVAVTSEPTSGENTYGGGEKIQITATFDEAVTVTGSPVINVEVGSNSRPAAYTGGTGTTALVFEYTVVAEDSDTDGISISADALGLNSGTIKDSDSNDADVTHAELRGQPDHKVDGSLPPNTRPTSEDGEVTTLEDTDYTFSLSDFAFSDTDMDDTLASVKIRLLPAYGQLKLNGTVISSVPQTITKAQLDAQQLRYESDEDWHGETTFTFRVSDGKADSADATMTVNVLNTPDVLSTDGVAVTSTPNSGTADTYGRGEKIQVTVTFDEPVTVTGSPFFRLRIYTTSGFQDRDATYMRGSGTTALEFEYVVVESDRDGNGVSSNADALMLNGGTIQDGDSNTADITHDALGNQSGHKVDGTLTPPTAPTVVSAVVAAAAPKELAITFDEALDTGSVPAASAFTVKVDGTAEATPTGVSISGAVVTLTLATALDNSQSNVTVDYTNPGSSNDPLKDAANNEVATFTGQSVTNNAPACPATASLPGDTLWTACLTVGVSSSGNDFGLVGDGSGEGALSTTASFTHEGTEYTIDGIVSSGTTVSISFDRALPDVSNAWFFTGLFDSAFLYIRENAGHDTTTHTYTWNTTHDLWTAANVGDKVSVFLELDRRAWASDSTVDTDEDTPYVFQASDFPYTHTGGDFPLEFVFIESLPINGQLKLDGTVISSVLSQRITKAQLDANQLTYEPPDDANGTGYAMFDFRVRVNGQWGLYSDTMTINVDSVPDVTQVAVTSTPTSGTTPKKYGAGEKIRITATFDEAVTVTGSPVVNVEVGSNSRPAAYTGGTGTTALVFEYTVVAADSDTDGISISANALTLDSDDKIEGSDNDTADITHAALAAQSGHQVDGTLTPPTAPTVTGAEVAAAAPKSLVITFDEALDTSSVPAASAFTVNVDGTAEATPTGVSISGSTVTLTLATALDGGQSSVTVDYTNPGTANSPLKDAANNEVATFTGQSVTNNAPACPDTASLPVSGSTFWVSCLTVGVSSSGNDFGLVGDGSGEGALSTASFTHEGTEYTIDGIVRSGTTFSISFDRALPDVSDAWVFKGFLDGRIFLYIRGNERDGLPATHTYDTTTHTYTWNYTPNGRWTAANVGDKGSVSLALYPRPWTSDSTVDTDEDTPYVFQASDFPYTHTGGDFPLEDVWITTLPANGQLKLDGTVLTEIGSNIVTRAQLDANQLTYEPPDDANGTGYAMFDFLVRVNDEWGGTFTGAAIGGATMTINVDSVPDVTGVAVTSEPTSGTTPKKYGAGEKIRITATFDEDVTVTGDPVVNVEVGSNSRPTAYVSGSTTTELVFEYTVVAGDTDTDGISINANALTLDADDKIEGSDNDTADITHDALVAQSDHQVDGTLTPPSTNTAPTAEAGSDQSVASGSLVTLDGSGTDDDGTIATYAWARTGGTGSASVTLSDAAAQQPTFTADTLTSNDGAVTHIFTLTVTDDDGATASDTVTITVTPPDNAAPTAEAGADQSVASGTVVTLDGSGSTDDDGSIASYAWARTGGTGSASVSLSDAAAQRPTFTADTLGSNDGAVTHIFTLTVTDDDGATASDTVTITVTPPDNAAPTAEAGADQSVASGSVVTLDGSGSTDDDGTIATYAWARTGGTGSASVTLSDAAAQQPTFTADTLGSNDGAVTHIFTLTVTDDDGATASDTVTITVTPPDNAAPTAEAGSDQSVASGSVVTLDGSGSTDDDGTIATYAWARTGGTGSASVTLSDAAAQQPTFTADTLTSNDGAVTHIFTLTVTDDDGATASDTVTITVTPPDNAAPTAEAGSDQSVASGSVVTLDGSGSTDDDGTIATYAWARTGGTGSASVTLSDAAAQQPTFTADTLTSNDGAVTHIFTLTVTDDDGATASDTVTITVTPPDNAAPTAEAGSDQSVASGSVVTLDGSGSTDDDGTIATYAWARTGGTGSASVSLSDAAAQQPTFTADTLGSNDGAVTHIFTLTVTDDDGATASDTVTITVTPPDNAAPTAGAGSDQSVASGSVVTLDGSGTDDDGTIATYAWARTGGTGSASVTLSDAAAQRPTFTADTLGSNDGAVTHIFTLTVTDDDGATASDTVTITVTPPDNAAPTAEAGSDQSVASGSVVTLDGSGTDDDGSIAAYTWARTGGTGSASVTLSDAAAQQPTFTADTLGSNDVAVTHIFTLTVTDDDGATASDTVTITVTPPDNAAPTAEAGADQSVASGSVVTLDGSGSTDDDGTIATYAWARTGGTGSASVTLSDAAAQQPTFTADTLGSNDGAVTHIFTLTVTDDDGATASDTVTITVTPPDNAAPTAEAGADQSVASGSVVTLDGSGTDDDGTIATYAWARTGGTPAKTVTLSDAAVAGPSFTADTLGSNDGAVTHIFTLTVTDDDGATASDTVTITVTPPDNAAPTAEAGSDQSVASGSLVTLDGSGTDDDGTVATYAWARTGGTGSASVTLSDAAAQQPTFTADTLTSNDGAVTHIFTLTVTDDDGATASDMVTITVTPPDNAAPTAEAGADQSVASGSLVTLDGSGSTDDDGTIATYAWARTGGSGSASVTLSDAAAQQPTFTADTLGSNDGAVTHIFTLTVTDDDGATASDTVTITVTPPDNAAPTAEAGADQSVASGSVVTLDGSGSTDDDGTIATYAWARTGGTGSASVSLSDAAAQQPTFTADTLGSNDGAVTHIFTLTVTDDDGATASDTVTITVTPPDNAAPTAGAGSDQSVASGSVVTLDGSGTDDDGTIATYAWARTGGTGSASVTLSDAAAQRPTFTADTLGSNDGAVTHIFTLTVTDDDGATASDTVTITVTPPDNAAPTAEAGADQSVASGTVVTLDGSGSTDDDGTIATYAWARTGGTGSASVSLSDAAAQRPTFTADTLGSNDGAVTHIFTLTVTDDDGATASDTVTITVTPPDNAAPTAEAGADQSVASGSVVTLDGSGSTDDDGTIATYAWTRTGGTGSASVTLSDAAAQQPTFTADTLGSNDGAVTHIFTLTVTDDDGATASDTVTITVTPPDNAAPTAGAGSDQSVASGSVVTLDGSGTDDDGTIATYAWARTGGTGSASVTLSDAAAQRPTFTADTLGSNDGAVTHIFTLTVTDDDGATASDTVTITVTPPDNAAPTAEAGADQSVASGSVVTLDGSGSTDDDGTIATYAWARTGGTGSASVTLSDAAAQQPTFTADTLGSNDGAVTHIFTLTVTDDDGATASDTVTITVTPPDNAAPTAGAGSDQSVASGSVVTLDGSGTDDDGTIATYAWARTGGTGSASVTLSDAAAQRPTFTADTLGSNDGAVTHIFTLTVTDDDGATASDTVTITVTPPDNAAPTAEAGADQSVASGSVVTLDGSGTDDDGSIATYAWARTGGPARRV